MPEGNEVHRWAERHNRAFAGKKIHVEGPNGRFHEADVLDGRKLERVMAKGKHLGYVFGKDRILHVHLGRYGDWTEGQMPLDEVRGALRLRMWPVGAKVRKTPATPSKRHGWYSEDDGTHAVAPEDIDWLELRGAAACELWTDAQWQALLDRLGPDPLDGDDPTPAYEHIRKAKTPISVLLMQQDVIAGIGNIYRAELLYRDRLNPFLEGREVPLKSLKAMWKDSIPLLKAGMVDRRIVTTRPKDRPTKKSGTPLKEEAHYVYRRHGKPCFVCGTKIMRQDIAGRTLYWCPTCQAGGGEAQG
ncbi:MAG TPA: DNA-formamidopyrimidine glycosylase family protein [Acidobacteriaceae bacterium]|jgi:endonuclease-8